MLPAAYMFEQAAPQQQMHHLGAGGAPAGRLPGSPCLLANSRMRGAGQGGEAAAAGWQAGGQGMASCAALHGRR